MAGDRGRRERRRLSESERTLWETVTRGIVRLAEDERRTVTGQKTAEPNGKPAPKAAKATIGDTAAPRATAKGSGKPASEPVPGASRTAVGMPASRNGGGAGSSGLPDIDRRTRRRLARGSERIEARLDLHGLYQEDAFRRLRGFLATAQGNGLANVLIITGKGRSPNDVGERGVLRRAVPQWLGQPALSRYVAGFGPAHHVHGGDGAFYVRIRRRARDTR